MPAWAAQQCYHKSPSPPALFERKRSCREASQPRTAASRAEITPDTSTPSVTKECTLDPRANRVTMYKKIIRLLLAGIYCLLTEISHLQTKLAGAPTVRSALHNQHKHWMRTRNMSRELTSRTVPSTHRSTPATLPTTPSFWKQSSFCCGHCRLRPQTPRRRWGR